jgi:hypothetical protein
MDDVPNCLTIDEMMTRLQDHVIINEVRNAYSSYDPRVLLSSFMLNKFPSELFVPHDLHNMCNSISEKMMNHADITKDEYDDFENMFKEWKQKEKEEMLSDMSNGITTLNNMKSDANDEADEQWNESVDDSIKNIREKMDILSSTP